MPDTLARMRQLIGTTAQWSANNLVLGDGEIGVEVVNASNRRFKVGDGVRTWSALPYSGVTQSSLDAEIANRAAADATLQANINAEAATRAQADTNEATARANADTAETNARIAADNAEASTRAAADTTLQTNITNEATARANADTAETNARIAADTAETNARIAGDAALAARLGGLEGVNKFVSAAAGNDSNDGSFGLPYQTWNKAYSSTPAGGTIWLDGSPEAPQTYKDTVSSLTTIAKEITVRAINKHGAILTSNGVTAAALAINSTAGDTINLIGVIIDPSLNGSSTRLNTLYLFSVATPYFVNCTDCLFRGWSGLNTGVGVSTSGIDFRGHLRFTRCTFTGNACANALRIDYLEQGGIELNDCDITLVNQNTVSNGAIRIVGTEPGVYARILNCRTSVSLDLSASTDSQRYGYNIINVKAAMVSGGTVDILGPGSVCSAYGVVIATNGAGDATELPIDDSVIEDVAVYCEPAGGGIAVLIGADGAADPAKANRCIIQRVKVRGGFDASAVGILHGVMLGGVTNGKLDHNEVVGTALSGLKNTINCDARHNRFWGATGYGFVCRNAKGGTVADNEIVFSPSANQNTPLLYLADVDGNVTSGVTISRNTFTNDGGTLILCVSILAGSSATFEANAWLNNCGTLAEQMFIVGTTRYSTFGAWKSDHGNSDVANFTGLEGEAAAVPPAWVKWAVIGGVEKPARLHVRFSSNEYWCDGVRAFEYLVNYVSPDTKLYCDDNGVFRYAGANQPIITAHGLMHWRGVTTITRYLRDLRVNWRISITGLGAGETLTEGDAVTTNAGGAGTYIDTGEGSGIACLGAWTGAAPVAGQILTGPNAVVTVGSSVTQQWIHSNVSVVRDQPGLDGTANRGCRVTALAANATIRQAITSASGTRRTVTFARRLVGAGEFALTVDGGTTWVPRPVTSTLWARYAGDILTLANPGPGLRLAASGDQVVIDFIQTSDRGPSQAECMTPGQTGGLGTAALPPETKSTQVSLTQPLVWLKRTLGSFLDDTTRLTVVSKMTPLTGDPGGTTLQFDTDGTDADCAIQNNSTFGTASDGNFGVTYRTQANPSGFGNDPDGPKATANLPHNIAWTFDANDRGGGMAMSMIAADGSAARVNVAHPPNHYPRGLQYVRVGMQWAQNLMPSGIAGYNPTAFVGEFAVFDGVPTAAELEALVPGSQSGTVAAIGARGGAQMFTFMDDAGQDADPSAATSITFTCPRSPADRPRRCTHPLGDWLGEAEAPTLAAPIACPGCGWTGTLEAGELVPAPALPPGMDGPSEA